MMLRDVFKRLFIGFSVGILINVAILILVSYAEGGEELSEIPFLAAHDLRKTDAFTLQMLASGLLGSVFAEAGILFRAERLLFPVKCLLHFVITAVFYVPFLLLCYSGREAGWVILLIVLNLLVTYLISWGISYYAARAEVKRLNAQIDLSRREQLNERN